MLFRPDRRFTLQNFVRQRSNAAARAAALALAGSQRRIMPTLVIAGLPGCGKSHLLHAVSRFAWQQQAPAACYAIAMRRLVDEVANGEYFADLPRLAKRLTEAHWLAIDDVDLLDAWPQAAEFLLKVLQQRQEKCLPSLLTATLGVSMDRAGKLGAWLDQVPAVLLRD